MRSRKALASAATVLLAVAALLFGAAADAMPAGAAPLVVSVGTTATSQPLAAGFLGFSIEYTALHQYAGRNPKHVDPVFETLLKGLSPGQQPVLRIGGDSADQTWWPVRGAVRPAGVTYALTKDWVKVAHSLAVATHAAYAFDINLAADNPLLAAVEGRELVAGVGPQFVSDLEIGNEPDLYDVFPWYTSRAGKSIYSRRRGYSMSVYAQQLRQWQAVLPNVPLTGPALSSSGWVPQFSTLKAADPALAAFTVHTYPLRACTTDPTAGTYGAIANLLSDNSSAGIAQKLAADVTTAHSLGLPLRLDELNSASCSGKAGVSDTFSSALWILDTLFNLAQTGVDGVNIHTLPASSYAPFAFTHKGNRWIGTVNPLYYGMLLFEQSFPPGAHLVDVQAPAGSLKVWATQDTAGRIRVVLINKDPSSASEVDLGVSGVGGPLAANWLTAPSLASTTGVTIGAQTFGATTTTGLLTGTQNLPQTAAQNGLYDIVVPPGSAVMLTAAP